MTANNTLILNRQDIVRCMQLGDYISAVEDAFRLCSGARMSVPDVVHIPAPDGAFHVKSAAFVGAPSYVAVKVNGNFPQNPRRNGLPTIQGAIVLCDGRDGTLLAVLDSAEVTAMRTGAATAVAAKYLAPQDTSTATLIGCGIQGRVQLLSLNQVLPLRTVYVFDSDRERTTRFAERMGALTGVEVLPVNDFAEATPVSQVIVTCTPSRSPFLQPHHVSQGTFIAAVGADNHDKHEISSELMAGARVVADVLDQCVQIGDLHHALQEGAMTRDDVVAELGDIVAGSVHPGLEEDDVVVFDSTGSAIQDVAAAGIIYERARAVRSGVPVEFS